MSSAATDGVPDSKAGADASCQDKKNTCWWYFTFPFKAFWFSFMTDVILRGYRSPLKAEDLTGSIYSFDTEEYYEKFQAAYAARKAKGLNGIGGALIATFRSSLWMCLILLMIAEAANLALPVIIKEIVNFLIDSQYGPVPPLHKGMGLAAALVIVVFISSIARTHSQNIGEKTGLRMRSVCFALIFNNCARLPSSALADLTTGHLVSLMTTDIHRFRDGMFPIMQMLVAPLVIAVTLGVLISVVGPITLSGFGILLIIIPMSAVFGIKLGKAQKNKMAFADQRVKMFGEAIQGIRVIKSYGWEDSFMERIAAIRKSESVELLINQRAMAVLLPIAVAIPALASGVTFVLRVVINGDLPAGGSSFLAAGYFACLSTPLIILPFGLSNLSQISVALGRIGKFLETELLELPARLPPAPIGESAVTVGPADFSWEVNGQSVLKNVEMRIPAGSLTAIVGKVGAGKSSLLSALLGEMVCMEPQPEPTAESSDPKPSTAPASDAATDDIILRGPGVPPKILGTVAYVSQQAFIMNATVKDNILFGRPYQHRLYKKSIAVAALGSDLKVLPQGDMTEIGERGVNLSGGQKQRVALARAVYANADVYLFDDPLSAVDAHVGAFIFEEMLVKHLADKTRILVTNQVQYLVSPEVLAVYVIENCGIAESGSYGELMSSESIFKMLVTSQQSAPTDDSAAAPDAPVDVAALASEIAAIDADFGITPMVSSDTVNASPSAPKALTVSRRDSAASAEHTDLSPKDSAGEPTPKEPGSLDDDAVFTRSGKLMQDEKINTAGISFSVFMYYFGNMSTSCGLLGLALLFLVVNPCKAVADEWYAKFAATKTLSIRLFIGIYAGATGLFLLLTMVRSFIWAAFAVKTANNIHDNAVRCILRCPTKFFETTPAGRILNRISKDQVNVDFLLSFMWEFVVNMFLQMLTVFGVIAYTQPVFLAALGPALILYFIARSIYRRAAIQFQRIDAVSLSPLFSLFSETLNGLPSVRAFRLQDIIRLRFYKYANATSNASSYTIFAQAWIRSRILIISVILVSGCAFVIVAFRSTVGIGFSGIALVYAVQILPLFEWFMQYSTDLEANMNSVERLQEFADLITEPPAVLPSDKALVQRWPSDGVVTFEGVEMRYRPGLPLVLKGLDFTVNAREKVGVVGRTGAGKSSLFVTLLRLVNISAGTIRIDGVDITTVGLTTLRQAMAIIPQDPVLFSGTIRSNLDPFNEHNDEEIWIALNRCHMAKAARRNMFSRATSKRLAIEAGTSATGGKPPKTPPSPTKSTAGPTPVIVEMESAGVEEPAVEVEASHWNSGASKAALESVVEEGGSNFSVGERQLLCLGRALLKSAKLLLLDEATASVDPETDALIQATIRKEFRECSMITIAHRLNTIMDSDRVLVMDNGVVAEYDSPARLLANPSSIFSSLAAESNAHDGKDKE